MSAVPTLTAIPQEGAKRLLGNFGSFVRTIQSSLAANPNPRWSRAASLLERDLSGLTAATRLSISGDHQPLVGHASRLRFLAKRMDGYKLDFAGPAVAQQLETQRRLIVLVAWQVFAAGSGSKASGL